jgi:hypothetical protein
MLSKNLREEIDAGLTLAPSYRVPVGSCGRRAFCGFAAWRHQSVGCGAAPKNGALYLI